MFVMLAKCVRRAKSCSKRHAKFPPIQIIFSFSSEFVCKHSVTLRSSKSHVLKKLNSLPGSKHRKRHAKSCSKLAIEYKNRAAMWACSYTVQATAVLFLCDCFLQGCFFFVHGVCRTFFPSLCRFGLICFACNLFL